jgi:hypothetical protein
MLELDGLCRSWLKKGKEVADSKDVISRYCDESPAGLGVFRKRTKAVHYRSENQSASVAIDTLSA